MPIEFGVIPVYIRTHYKWDEENGCLDMKNGTEAEGFISYRGSPPQKWTHMKVEETRYASDTPSGAYLITDCFLAIDVNEEPCWHVDATYSGEWGSDRESFVGIPKFNHVRRVVQHEDSNVLIFTDLSAGAKDVYSVVRLCMKTGHARTIGRELPLDLANKVAERDVVFDGAPIEDQ